VMAITAVIAIAILLTIVVLRCLCKRAESRSPETG
jgi:hypothetical protein